jgi:Tfp pilus assembly protein PilE
MICEHKNLYSTRKGVALIVAMIFLAIFGALAVAMTSMSSTNIQSSSNQQEVANALASAQSGLECAKYLVSTVTLASTNTNTVSDTQANTAWGAFCTHVQSQAIGGATVSGRTAITGGEQITVSNVSFAANGEFGLRFYKYNSDPNVFVESTGTDGAATRKVQMRMLITKDAKVLQYAIASRGRMWITGDSTIHGSVYSSWNLSNSQLTQLTALKDQINARLAAGTLNSTSFSPLISSLGLTLSEHTTILNRLLGGTLSSSDAVSECIKQMTIPGVSPFNTTSDSHVEGTIDTIWFLEGDETSEGVEHAVWQFGNEILGSSSGVNYGMPVTDMPGMSIADYDTTIYYLPQRPLPPISIQAPMRGLPPLPPLAGRSGAMRNSLMMRPTIPPAPASRSRGTYIRTRPSAT